MKVEVKNYRLLFKKPAKTSRNTLEERNIHYLILRDKESDRTGIGECAPIFGLSSETRESLASALRMVSEAQHIEDIPEELLIQNPSIRFALETAELDLKNGSQRKIFDIPTTTRIPINGLVWMNQKQEMLEEAFAKIEAGFRCIKLKIGGIHFEEELSLLSQIREKYSPSEVEIRLDANGSFSGEGALEKLNKLSRFSIHSIEQPVRAGQWAVMNHLCRESPIPIALDEELIPWDISKEKMLDEIMPQYIILKPTLHGGFAGSNEWIRLAEERKIRWWATSALESNIGLNAIAQWVATFNNPLPQGLGTGKLYVNNILSPLNSGNGYFWWDFEMSWAADAILSL